MTELLVVTAITATLAGILLPAVGLARSSARSATCQGNLRQWGVALYSYMADNRGVIPRRGQGIQPTMRIDRPDDWFNCLPPYTGELSYKQRVASGHRPQPKDGSLFVCPEAHDDIGVYFFSYAMNMYLSPWVRPQAHRFVDIPRPQNLVFLADAAGPYSSTVPSSKAYSVVPRHNGRANLLFLDGHVESHEGKRIGCGVGDPRRVDVRWLTDSDGVNQTPVP